MSRPYDLVTFDCFGTLVDWESGIWGAFEGRSVERADVIALHAAIEPEVQAAGHRAYREVLRETARRIGARLGLSFSAAEAAFLADGLGDWPVFPDTVPALARLAGAGYRLGILSNVDDDLLALTRRRLGIDFEPIVTAEQVRSYKPAHGHFLEARRRAGDVRWLHAAQSWFHDVVPATALGIPVVWINRKHEPPGDGPPPLRELTTLAELADWLA